MELLSDPNIWIAFFMLAALEIVLGIDNIIFTDLTQSPAIAEVRHRRCVRR